MQDIFAVQDEIAAGVVEAVRVPLATRSEPAPSRPQVKNIEAYGHYQSSAPAIHQKRSRRRPAFLSTGHRDRSDPCASWVGMAEVTSLSAGLYRLARASDAYAKAKESLATAEHEQGESAEARYVEGMIALGERDWSGSERALMRALEIEPANVRALCWRARLLVMLGRTDQALTVLQPRVKSIRWRPIPTRRRGSVCSQRVARPNRCSTLRKPSRSMPRTRWRCGPTVRHRSPWSARRRAWRCSSGPIRRHTAVATSTPHWDGRWQPQADLTTPEACSISCALAPRLQRLSLRRVGFVSGTTASSTLTVHGLV
jgi:Tetratricopeptide repeat